MIRDTVTRTMSSTFMVRVPEERLEGMPCPKGTGFFITPDGYFITAGHVVESVDDFARIWLERPGETPPALVQYVELVRVWDSFDLALLKADFERNTEKAFLAEATGFSYLEIDFERQLEGTPVYSYGFPLPKTMANLDANPAFMLNFISPRITSAVIASRYDYIRPVRGVDAPRFYAIDKALNYGNSGGPVVLTESGKVISVCVRFQPVQIPQEPGVSVTVPSPYAITSSLNNIQRHLEDEIGLPS